MTESTRPQLERTQSGWLDRQVRRRPELPYIGPFLVYLALLSCESLVDSHYYKLHFYALRTAGGLGAALLFWTYNPPFGRLHPVKCLFFGGTVAYGWVMIHRLVAGQYCGDEWIRPRRWWYV